VKQRRPNPEKRESSDKGEVTLLTIAGSSIEPTMKESTPTGHRFLRTIKIQLKEVTALERLGSREVPLLSQAFMGGSL
jgi:hypothetical protein